MEDAYLIHGGRPLTGEVTLSGAKNVSLKAIIAALLFESEVVLTNVPRINDVFELLHLIRVLGGKADFTDKNTVTIDGREITSHTLDLLHSSKIRVSFMLFAPLLHKLGKAQIPNPGGCRLGARSIDRIVDGLKAYGASITYDSTSGYYNAVKSNAPKGMYTFPKPSHTGTELLIMYGALGTETVQIKGAALEPEVDELISFLNQAGAKIVRNGDTITIAGVQKLVQTVPFRVVSDRNEAVTFATLAVATHGDVTIHNLTSTMIEDFERELTAVGAGVTVMDSSMRFYYSGPLRPSAIVTGPHPGFMTDWQPNWAVLMTQADGVSTIHERVFENRFAYVSELNKLGAGIEYIEPKTSDPESFYLFNYDSSKSYKQMIQITGPKKLHNGVMTVADLRAGASLLIAGLMAEGESVIQGASVIDRGYEDLVLKITALGGTIKKL